jgi:hypothetical protein
MTFQMVRTCCSSYSGQGRRIAGAQEFGATLGKKARPPISKKSQIDKFQLLICLGCFCSALFYTFSFLVVMFLPQYSFSSRKRPHFNGGYIFPNSLPGEHTLRPQPPFHTHNFLGEDFPNSPGRRLHQ